MIDEIQIKVEQHLIGCPGTSLKTIETVQSHPMALAQCSRFFQTHPRLKSVVADDTAGSVAEVIRLCDPKLAAIAGRRAADLYGGSIICERIQDHSDNYTRFVLLTKPTLSVKEHNHDRQYVS